MIGITMKQLGIFLFMVLMVFTQNDKNTDTQSVENLSKAYYDILSGPKEKKRDWDRFKNLFHADARLIYASWNKETKQQNLLQMNVEEYIGKLGYTETLGFYEEEFLSITESFSSVYQVWSTYHFRTGDSKIKGRGVTSYQVLFDGKSYKILNMFWCLEDDFYTLPDKYVKKK